jgi:ATP-binding cassette, subfamily B, multidrug efflux pump
MNAVFKLKRFIGPYWLPSVLSLLCLIVLVFLDLAIPRLVERIIDEGIGANNESVVIQTGLIMLGISALSTLFSIANNGLSVRVGESVARDIREALFQKIQSFSFGNLDEMKTGQLLVRLTSDITAFQRFTQVTLRIGTRAPMMMIGSLILMFSTSPSLALTMLPMLAVTGALIVFFILRTEPLVRAVQQKLDALNTVLQENVAGARLVKSFVRGAREGARFETANEDFAAESIGVMRFMSSMGPVLTMCVNIGIVVVIWVGGFSAANGDLTVGQVVAFTNYLLTTMTPLIMMTMLAGTWAAGIASAKRVSGVLDTDAEVRDAIGAIALPEPARGRIAFENVSFHYHGQTNELVLEDVSFVVEAGTTVAVLGATGAGKSTLVNLVPRFYDATAGRITIDGHDVRALLQDSLLKHIAMVPQETILFSGSVRDNIRYGVPAASDDEVLVAAQAAQAHDFVLKLPKGYDTHIEERGVNLSGGQKQRLAIARALLARPTVLILDDSTSAVDVDTETRIQAALERLMSRQTRLVVAQRISTVLHADKIIVLDKGCVAAEGTHAALMRESAIYREIYDTQLGAGQIDTVNAFRSQRA